MQALRVVNGGDEQAVLRAVLKAKEHHRRVALSHEKPGPEWEVGHTCCTSAAMLPTATFLRYYCPCVGPEFFHPQTVPFCIVCSSSLRCTLGGLILNLLCGD